MLLHNAVDHDQTDARALAKGLGGKIRLKEVFQGLGVQAVSGVLNDKLAVSTV